MKTLIRVLLLAAFITESAYSQLEPATRTGFYSFGLTKVAPSQNKLYPVLNGAEISAENFVVNGFGNTSNITIYTDQGDGVNYVPLEIVPPEGRVNISASLNATPLSRLRWSASSTGDSLWASLVPRGFTGRILSTGGTNLSRCSAFTPAPLGVTGNFGNSTGGHLDWLSVGTGFRIQAYGTIRRIGFYLTNGVQNVTNLTFSIWRKSGTIYNRVGVTENLTSFIGTAGSVNIADVATKIKVKPGDYVGGSIDCIFNLASFFHCIATPAHTIYYITNITGASAPPATNFPWASQTPLQNNGVPIEVYITTPTIFSIGDSLIAGHPGNYSFMETNGTAVNQTNEIVWHLAESYGVNYQNVGIGSQTTTLIRNRLTNDVLNHNPRLLLINGGINDLALGVSKAACLGNWTNILTVLTNQEVVPVVLLMFPWTNGTDQQNRDREIWNADLLALCNSMGVLAVDCTVTLGQNRPAGDVGNLWDLKTAYDADGIHLNVLGYSDVAAFIKTQIDAHFSPRNLGL